MMRTFAAFLAIVAVDAPLAPAGEGSTQQQGPKNLVRHASLEAPVGADGLPDGWDGTYFQPDESYKVLVVDGGRTGDKSLVIQGKGSFGVVSTNKVLLDRNVRYRARGWIRIEGDARAAADVKFHYFDANHEYLGQTRIPFVSPPTKDWTLVEVTDRTSDFPKAKWIQVAVALAGNGKAQFDDLELTAHPRDEVPDDFDLSPELRPLQRFIGSWESQIVMKPAEWTPEKQTMTITDKVEWTLRGRVIEHRFVWFPDNIHSLGLMTYDAQKRKYRQWYFDSNGQIPQGEESGEWDEATRTFTWKGSLDDGTTSTQCHRFIDNDTLEWRMVIKDRTGKVCLDMQSKAKRK